MGHPRDLEAVFSKKGLLSHALGRRFERRPQQEWMARQVARRLEEGGVALVEAGTGVGKSLGYLLPLLIHLSEAGPATRAVVATYTIHLQEQLNTRELPVARQALGREVRTAVAKGWGNYLCRLRLQRLREGRHGFLEGIAGGIPDGAVEALSRWEGETPTGSLSDLPPEVGPDTWAFVAADPERCTRRRCPFYESCFYFAARRHTFQAQLIVANQHLLMADLVLRRQTDAADAAVLPSFDYLVVDEAHHLDDVAAAHLGYEVGRGALIGRLQRLARGKAAGLAGAAAEALAAAARLFDSLSRAAHEMGSEAGESGRTLALSPGDGERLVPEAILSRALAALEQLARSAESVADQIESLDTGAEGEERVTELRSLARWALGNREKIEALLEAADEGYVYWVETGPGREVTLKAAPLDVGPVLAGELLGTVRAAVLTSATLAGGGSFSSIRRRLGLPASPEGGIGKQDSPPRDGEDEGPQAPEVDKWGVLRAVIGSCGEPRVMTSEAGIVECVIPSPFDFRRQAMVALPSDLPEVDSPDFTRRLADLVADLSLALGGRLFALFTSYRTLAQTSSLLRTRLGGQALKLLCQGDRPRTQMLEAFRSSEGVGWVLLGTDSFWEGVDVPGAALSCVVLARLPFPVPDHPINRARAERLRQHGFNPFWEEALPRAVLKFRQGFGRLIRTQHDRGAVVVADRRLLTRPYRVRFLEALPRWSHLPNAWYGRSPHGSKPRRRDPGAGRRPGGTCPAAGPYRGRAAGAAPGARRAGARG
ncbi:MAG: helicase C-terminal domain-containing protein [Bacillota bacterium]